MSEPTATSASAAETENTCPDCRVNQVEPPFFYCSLCEMLTSYFTNNVATREQLSNPGQYHESFEAWRNALTWAEMERLRDEYWTPRRQRARARNK